MTDLIVVMVGLSVASAIGLVATRYGVEKLGRTPECGDE